MKYLCVAVFFAVAVPLLGAASNRAATTVVLDETGMKNLRLETVAVEEGDFEETIFALGRVAIYPGKRAVLSSRIPGRAVRVFIKPDHPIKEGEVAIVIESRQPGNPPPTVELKAPITGLVSKSHVDPGQPVEPSEAFAEILDLREVYALAQVPEHLAGLLQRGQLARIRVPAVPGQTFAARLEHLGAEADAISGTVEAAFRVENPEEVLRPGMRAEFSIVVRKRTGVMSVPRSALQGDAANRFVYVKDFDLPNAFIKTPVVVGQIVDEAVEILSGLLPADEVVTKGAYSLAFAGGGTVSLKGALDAAHGHEHNEDGSEMTPEQREAKKAAAAGNAASQLKIEQSPFWMMTSGVLFVLLVLVSLRRARQRS